MIFKALGLGNFYCFLFIVFIIYILKKGECSNFPFFSVLLTEMQRILIETFAPDLPLNFFSDVSDNESGGDVNKFPTDVDSDEDRKPAAKNLDSEEFDWLEEMPVETEKKRSNLETVSDNFPVFQLSTSEILEKLKTEKDPDTIAALKIALDENLGDSGDFLQKNKKFKTNNKK